MFITRPGTLDRLPNPLRILNSSAETHPTRLLQRGISYFTSLMGRGRAPTAPVLAAAADGQAHTPTTTPAASPLKQQQPTPPANSSKRKKTVEASLNVQTNQRQLQPKADRIAEQLAKLYPNPPIPLNHDTNFQLLCAVLLSAQTTDIKVNEVTKELFRIAPDAASMAALDVATITTCIKQLGLAPTKAKNLKAMATLLIERHGGEVPSTFEELEELPGVGHKTASVVMAQAFGHDAFPVDTHIHRLAQRWGLTCGKSVEQTEADLKLLFPPTAWRDLHLQIIYFGREKCPARSHDPAICPICCWAAVAPYDKAGNSPLKPGQSRNGGAGGNQSGQSVAGRKRAAGPAKTKAGAKRGKTKAKPKAADSDVSDSE